MVAPIITVPDAQFLQVGSEINFLPSVLALDGVSRWEIQNPPPGVGIDSVTGRISGICTVPNIYKTFLLAYSGSDFDKVAMPTQFYNELRTISMANTYPMSFTGTHVCYKALENISVPGTLAALIGQNIGFNLNGFEVLFDTFRDQTITNGSFNTGDATGWDLTGAPGAVVAAHSYIDWQRADDPFSLKVPLAPGETKYFETVATYTVSAGKAWCLNFFHNKSSSITYRVEFLGSSLIAASSNILTNKPGTICSWHLQKAAPLATTVTGKIRFTMTNNGTSTFNGFFARIRLDEMRKHCIARPQSGDSERVWAPTVSGPATGSNLFVANGTIRQGAGANFDCSPLFMRSAGSPVVHKCLIESHADATTGPAGCPLYMTYCGNWLISHNTLRNQVRWIGNREQFEGATIRNGGSTGTRNLYRNLFDGSPQSGMYFNTTAATGPIIIDGNVFRLKSKYTNGFCLNINSDRGIFQDGNQVINNVADYEGTADLASRGFQFVEGRGFYFHNNYICVQELPHNQEYRGYVTFGAYGLQFELTSSGSIVPPYSNGDVLVDGDTYRVVGHSGGCALRLKTKEAAAGLITIRNTNLEVDADSFEYGPSASDRAYYAVIFARESNLDLFRLENLNITTNAPLFIADQQISTGTLLLDGGDIRYINSGFSVGNKPWYCDYKAQAALELRGYNYHDAGTLSWLRQDADLITQSGTGPFSFDGRVTHDCDFTFVNGSTPQGSLPVTIKDASGVEVFSGSTNGDGLVEANLVEFRSSLTAMTLHTPHEIRTTFGDGTLTTLTLSPSTRQQIIDVVLDDETDVSTSPPVIENFGPTATIQVNEGDRFVAAIEVAGNPPPVGSLSGPDAGEFELVGNILQFLDNPDYENPTDANLDNTYQVTTGFTNSGGFDSTSFTIPIINEADTPPALTSGTEFDVPSVVVIVCEVTATGEPIPELSIIGGADAEFFSLIDEGTGRGTLQLNSLPDHRSPLDANGDNTYEVLVQAANGVGAPAQQLILATVTQPISIRFSARD